VKRLAILSKEGEEGLTREGKKGRPIPASSCMYNNPMKTPTKEKGEQFYIALRW